MHADDDDDDVFHDALVDLSDAEDEAATASAARLDAAAAGASGGAAAPLHTREQPGGSNAPAASRLPLHRAAFNGDLAALETALHTVPPSQWTELDDCGNTALHVAVLRRNKAAVALLLECGFPPQEKSAAGWAAIYEAVAAHDQPLVLMLHTAAVRAQEDAYRRRKPELAAALAALPDFRAALRWEFCSPLFAPLLRRFAPHDTYVLTKRGACLRVDGTLKGVVDEAAEGGGGGASLLPQWDRGAFSLLFAAPGAAAVGHAGAAAALPQQPGRMQLLLADHDKRECVDALPPGEARAAEALAEEAAALLAGGPAKGKLRAREFSFAPLRTWRGEPRRERAEGWHTTLYEAKGRLEAQTRVRSGRFALRGTFEQYLASAADGAADELMTLDLAEAAQAAGEEGEEGSQDGGGSGSAGSSVAGDELRAESGGSGGSRGAAASQAGGGAGATPPRRRAPPPSPVGVAAKAAKPSKPRAFTGRLWMADGHPLSVRSLFPLLDVCSSVNKHFAKVRKFLAKWADVDACPVRLQVPLFMTVYAQVCIRDFELLPPDAPLPLGFFAAPEGYRTVSLEEKMEAMEARAAAANRGRRGGGSGDDDGAGEAAEEEEDGGWGPRPRPHRRHTPATDAAAATGADGEERAGGAM